MKTFKQFIIESPVDNEYTVDRKFKPYPHTYKDPEMESHAKHHETIDYDNDYEIHHKVEDNGPRYGTKHYWHIVHKPTGNIHLRLTTHTQQNNGIHRVSDLIGSDENQLKTVNLYHHLLKTKKIRGLLSDHTHSKGAKKIWERLSKTPGIKVRLMKKGQQLPLKSPWSRNYGDFSTLFLATHEDVKH